MADTNQTDKQNPEFQWDFSSLFSGDDDGSMADKWDKFVELTTGFVEKWSERQDYLSDAKILEEALNDFEAWVSAYPDEVYYFGLREAQETNNDKVKAAVNKVEELFHEQINRIQFFELNLGKVDEEHQEVFLQSPLLIGYKHYLERIFENAKYDLSEEVEQVMLLKSQTAYRNWVKMTDEFLNKETVEVLGEEGEQETKPFNELFKIMNSHNQEVRDDAALKFNQVLVKHIETGTAEVNSLLTDKAIDDKLRGYERPDKSRHVGDDIETEVVDAMLEQVVNNFDIAHSFYQLKAKLFGKEQLAYHERNLEYGEIKGSYPYQDSLNLVIETFAELDQEFADILQMFADKGQIDVYPRQGKTGGAFCAHGSRTQPVYILLNHTDKLRDVLTIAHEAGHGINDEFMRQHQNGLSYSTPMSTAEVASTFMEDFVLEKLLQEADDEVKLAVMMHKLNDDISTIFRQVACYKFEQDLHARHREQKYLSTTEIGEIFTKNMQAYMGDGVSQDPGSQNWWLYWSHIRSYFYVYSYASGLLISKALQAKVRADKQFITEIKLFLSAGRSQSPRDLFNQMGIDITNVSFWQEGIAQVAQLLEETHTLAKKLNKI